MDKYLEQEAAILGKYIIRIPINKKSIDFYCNSIIKNPIKGSEKENSLVKQTISNPWLLPYYDAALSLTNPEHTLKKKLLRMFAILETRAEYSNFFLGREFSRFYIIKIIWIGIIAVFKTLIGLIITPRQ